MNWSVLLDKPFKERDCMTITELNQYCESNDKFILCRSGKLKGIFSIFKQEVRT